MTGALVALAGLPSSSWTTIEGRKGVLAVSTLACNARQRRRLQIVPVLDELACTHVVVHQHGAYVRRRTSWRNRCRRCAYRVDRSEPTAYAPVILAVVAIHFVELARDLLHSCHILPLHGFLQAHVQNCTPLVQVLWMGRR